MMYHTGIIQIQYDQLTVTCIDWQPATRISC